MLRHLENVVFFDRGFFRLRQPQQQGVVAQASPLEPAPANEVVESTFHASLRQIAARSRVALIGATTKLTTLRPTRSLTLSSSFAIFTQRSSIYGRNENGTERRPAQAASIPQEAIVIAKTRAYVRLDRELTLETGLTVSNF
jgi:hypothetical protein